MSEKLRQLTKGARNIFLATAVAFSGPSKAEGNTANIEHAQLQDDGDTFSGVIEEPPLTDEQINEILTRSTPCDLEKDPQPKLLSCVEEYGIQNWALHQRYNRSKTDIERKDVLIKINRLGIALGRIIEAYERRFNSEDWMAQGWTSRGVSVEAQTRELLTSMKKTHDEKVREQLLDAFVANIPETEADARATIQALICGRFDICKLH